MLLGERWAAAAEEEGEEEEEAGETEGTEKAKGPAVPGLVAEEGPVVVGEAEWGSRGWRSNWARWPSRSVTIEASRCCWLAGLGGTVKAKKASWGWCCCMTEGAAGRFRECGVCS